MKDLLSWQSFLLFASMLAVTYSTRLIVNNQEGKTKSQTRKRRIAFRFI